MHGPRIVSSVPQSWSPRKCGDSTSDKRADCEFGSDDRVLGPERKVLGAYVFISVIPATFGTTRCIGLPFHRLASGASLSLSDSVWNLASSVAVSLSTSFLAS